MYTPPHVGFYKLEIYASRVPKTTGKINLPLVATFMLEVKLKLTTVQVTSGDQWSVTTVETCATGSIERLRRKSESGVVFPKQERNPRDGVGPWRGAEIVKVCFFVQSLLFFALVLVSSGGT